MPKKTFAELEEIVTVLQKENEALRSELDHCRSKLFSATEKLTLLIDKTKKELNLSQEIQQHLVPTELPSIPGFDFSSKFVAGTKLGGDYFDVFPHRDMSKYGIVVSSSSGYLASACFLSALLGLTGYAEDKGSSDPAEVVNLICEEVARQIDNSSQVDFIYCIFDRKKFELNYVMLGDVIALHQPFGSGAPIELKSDFGPLDKSYKGGIQSKKIKLSPRDRIIFISKGATKTQGVNHTLIGRETLIDTVEQVSGRGAHLMRNKICYDLDRFRHAERPLCDVTVVVGEVKDRVIKLA